MLLPIRLLFFALEEIMNSADPSAIQQDCIAMKSLPTVLAAFFIISGALGGCSRNNHQPPSEGKHKVEEHSEKSHPTPTQVTGYAPVELEPERLQLMGITTANISLRHLTRTLRTVGIGEMDETRVAQVQTKFSGWIEDLYVDFIGKPVKRGQPLSRFTVRICWQPRKSTSGP
jgi:hypothetical protein